MAKSAIGLSLGRNRAEFVSIAKEGLSNQREFCRERDQMRGQPKGLRNLPAPSPRQLHKSG